ncbi:MAG: hypothetical protein H7246_00975 [Phycisphaerae bacterium]|nr:hypothetical protein [Saprospiraceae bacterium]
MADLRCQERDYQAYKRQLDSFFISHKMIKDGASWQDVHTHLAKQAQNSKNQLFYRINPELAAVSASVQYRKRFPKEISLDTASVDALLALLLDTLRIPEDYSIDRSLMGDYGLLLSYEKSGYTSKILEEIVRRGKPALPTLMKHLDNDAATRTIIDTGDSNQEMPYAVRIRDYVVCLIERISYCDFMGYAVHNIFSDQSQKEQQKTKQSINNWWAKNEHSSTKNGIIWHLKYQNFTTRMCQNLAALGEKELAVKYLKEQYNKYRNPTLNPCFPMGSELTIARVLEKEYNIEVALKDCANNLLEYRCYDNRDKVSYVIEFDSTGTYYATLAAVVETEPYTTEEGHKDLWKQIFYHIVEKDKKEALPILLQLMKRTEYVFARNSGMSAHQWVQQYPESQKNDFRVCDFALLKWIDLSTKYKYPKDNEVVEFIQQLGPIDYSDEPSRDSQIIRILEKFDKK